MSPVAARLAAQEKLHGSADEAKTDDEVQRHASGTIVDRMRLVIVTGAGASTLLGPEGRPIPMMGEWNDVIIDELNRSEHRFATAIGLTKGQSGEAFEETVGAFTAWRSHLDEAERFLAVGGSQPMQKSGEVVSWLQRQRARGSNFNGTLLRTLHEKFGTPAIDRDRAETAYQRLLGLTLQGGRPVPGESSVVFATTNYDLSIELALMHLGYSVTNGRSDRGVETPVLEPQGMVDRTADGFIPVIHLHGAVGWYRKGGRILVFGSDLDYNPTLGEPALLMPDPEKDPARDAAELWAEFRQAMKTATHVLVAGHSLHDEHLVREIRLAQDRGAFVGVTFLRDPDRPIDQERENAQRAVISAKLPSAVHIAAKLGPEMYMHPRARQLWRLGVADVMTDDSAAASEDHLSGVTPAQ